MKDKTDQSSVETKRSIEISSEEQPRLVDRVFTRLPWHKRVPQFHWSHRDMRYQFTLQIQSKIVLRMDFTVVRNRLYENDPTGRFVAFD
jgi:hypothetical protein